MEVMCLCLYPKIWRTLFVNVHSVRQVCSRINLWKGRRTVSAGIVLPGNIIDEKRASCSSVVAACNRTVERTQGEKKKMYSQYQSAGESWLGKVNKKLPLAFNYYF